MGSIETAIAWYIGASLVAAWIAWRYDAWIAKAHQPDVQNATRRVIPTSFLVVLGVASTEIFRLIRASPVLYMFPHLSDWLDVPRLLAIWTLDALTAYAATGLPMVIGDIRREARAQQEARTRATERAKRVVQEAQDSANAT